MKKKMKSVNNKVEECYGNCGKKFSCGGCGGIYGVGFVGAAIYYISTASGFWVGVFGVLKALVWPAILEKFFWL